MSTMVYRWVDLSPGERGAVVRAVWDDVHGDLLITPSMRWYRIMRSAHSARQLRARFSRAEKPKTRTLQSTPGDGE